MKVFLTHPTRRRRTTNLTRAHLRVTAGLLLAAIPAAAFAGPRAEEAADLGEIVISANRTPTEAAKIGSDVTVIGRDELERSKETLVKDVLDRVVGVNFTQNGPAGATTTIEMRGAYAGYVLVRVDGIDVSDPSAAQVAAAIEHLSTADVERIEILRGSQSALYGGTAIGGVIDITTRKAEAGGVHHSAGVEAGSHGTVAGTYGLSAATDTSEVNVSISRFHTDGFSAADARKGNTEKDGYENTTFSANAVHRISDVFRVFGAMRHTRTVVQNDRFLFGVGAIDEAPGAPREHGVGETVGGRVGADVDLLDGRFKNTFAVQYWRSDRDGYGAAPRWWYRGERTKFEYLGSFVATDTVGLSFGADHAIERGASSSFSGDIGNTGVFGQVSWEPLKGVTLTAALRNDHHSKFGDHPTHRLTAAWAPFEGTKVRASWGTGFRAPSVSELFMPVYGNPTLKPETSRSFDVGIDQKFWSGRASVSATVFALDTTDLIGYDPATFRSIQVPGTTRRHGVELSGRVQVLDRLALEAGYTFTEAHKADHSRLVRVPRHKATMGATATPFEKTTVSVRGTLVSGMVDTDYSIVLPDWSSPVRALPTWFLLDATGKYAPTDNLEFSLEGKNLLDRKYQTVWGYGTAGASIRAGVTAKF
ncbi:MAG: TonB-dependent receptor [Siculibacillus sp.]|nr:TonB-dependent receptor [Siculibacillus sp.]